MAKDLAKRRRMGVPVRVAISHQRLAMTGAGALSVAVTDGRGRSARVPGLAAWLRRAAPARARGEVAIALVSDARIRMLNRTYRAKDYATDVLSFPAQSAASKGRPTLVAPAF